MNLQLLKGKVFFFEGKKFFSRRSRVPLRAMEEVVQFLKHRGVSCFLQEAIENSCNEPWTPGSILMNRKLRSFRSVVFVVPMHIAAPFHISHDR